MSKSEISPTAIACLFLMISFNGFATTSALSSTGIDLLNLTDRGSNTNTPYTVPCKSMLLESGYGGQHFTPGGTELAFPQTFIFFGLPNHSELIVGLPNYHQQPDAHISGFTAIKFGAKHEIGQGKNWATAAEVSLTLPGGSTAFGSQGTGASISGLMSYSINSKISLSFMISGATETLPSLFGGGRFNSVLPSLELGYAPTETTNIFAEVFGQNQTGPGLGGNYNVDCGILYLLKPSVVLDFELGRQLSNEQASFRYYINGGVSILF